MEKIIERAMKVMPGGVNSPARSFKAVGCPPIIARKGKGSEIHTADGRTLLDFCCSWGALPLGHAHPDVVEAACRAVEAGSSYGVTNEYEVELAELICRQVPSVEMVRLVNSGTEAAMTALRLARGFTGRSKIIKFDGCYHGHADTMLVSAGSGVLTHGIPGSPGIPQAVTDDVFVAAYNDPESVREIVSVHGESLAAIVVEPVAGNMGLVLPDEGFLAALREICNSCGALLIFDEVITGFRFAPTTYGNISGVSPDIVCLGKIIGGGFPIGGIGGRREVMECLAPCGPVYQAGTLSGNPVAAVAGLATLRRLISDLPYAGMDMKGRKISAEVVETGRRNGIPVVCNCLGGAFTVFFNSGRIRNLADAKKSNTEHYGRFFRKMLEKGLFLPPSQFETAFISSVHSDSDIERFLSALPSAFKEIVHGKAP